MSIKNFSKAYFTEVAIDTIKHHDFIYARNIDKLQEDTSFREVLDMTSLDIAELIISLEQKIHINMEEILTERIDNINDLYNEFLKCIYKTRKSFAQKQALKNKVLTK